MVADFDFRGLADILGSHAHIGFLEADSVRPKFSHLLPNLLMGLCIALSGCVAKAASSAKSMDITHKYSFDFGLGEEESHPEELTIVAGMDWVHTVSGRVKDMGQEEEKKIPKSVGAKTQPCFTPLFIHGAHDAFVVGDNHWLMSVEEHPIFSRSWNRPSLITRSNALVRSTKAR